MLHALLTSELDGCVWSASCFGRWGNPPDSVSMWRPAWDPDRPSVFVHRMWQCSSVQLITDKHHAPATTFKSLPVVSCICPHLWLSKQSTVTAPLCASCHVTARYLVRTTHTRGGGGGVSVVTFSCWCEYSCTSCRTVDGQLLMLLCCLGTAGWRASREMYDSKKLLISPKKALGPTQPRFFPGR
jgi:hypothetical protein